MEIKISDLPSKGIYYKKDAFIKVRALTDYEQSVLKSMKSESLSEQIKKLEFAMLSVETNLDEFDFCYTDVFYIYYILCKLTYPEILVDLDGEGYECAINEKDFFMTNPKFKSEQDLFFEECNIKFNLPTMYNMSKAYKNILKHSNTKKSQSEIERFALVPYMQREKISDKALEFINEHLNTFSDDQISRMRKFLNDKENVVLGQKMKIFDGLEDREVLINLGQLV